LNSPVVSVRQDEKGVIVQAVSPNKRFGPPCLSVRAKRVVIAVPLALTSHIRFSPLLPLEKRTLWQKAPMGWIVKAFVAYDEPFWRKQGFSGESLAPESALSITFDVTPPPAEGQELKVGLICLLAFNDGARRLISMNSNERREAIVQAVVQRFGPQGAEPSRRLSPNVIMMDWSTGTPSYWSHDDVKGESLQQAPPPYLSGFHLPAIARCMAREL